MNNETVDPDLVKAGKKEKKKNKRYMIAVELESSPPQYKLKEKKDSDKNEYICQRIP